MVVVVMTTTTTSPYFSNDATVLFCLENFQWLAILNK
jgi:hypothetical protein